MGTHDRCFAHETEQQTHRMDQRELLVWQALCCFPLNWMWHTARAGCSFSCNTPQRKLTTNISSAVENLPLLPINGFSIIVLFSVVDFFSYAGILESFGNEGSCCNHCRCFSGISGVRDVISPQTGLKEKESQQLEKPRKETLISHSLFFPKALDILFICVALVLHLDCRL